MESIYQEMIRLLGLGWNGVQFKINTDKQWKEDDLSRYWISLGRINHVSNPQVICVDTLEDLLIKLKQIEGPVPCEGCGYGHAPETETSCRVINSQVLQ